MCVCVLSPGRSYLEAQAQAGALPVLARAAETDGARGRGLGSPRSAGPKLDGQFIAMVTSRMRHPV